MPYQHGKWDAMLEGEVSITVEVLHKYPSLDTQGRWEVFWTASTSPLLFTPCHFYQGQLSNCNPNVRFGVPYHHREWDVLQQGDILIHCC